MAERATDPGLQAERTELAWRRTQVSLLVLACLAVRGHSPVLMVSALTTAVVLGLSHRWRYPHSLAMLRHERGRARACAVLGTGGVLVMMGLWEMQRVVRSLSL